MPVHEHDCDTCTFLASYPMRNPYFDDEDGYRTGTPGKWVGMADVYFACDNSGYKYIVRYGIQGEYATTNQPSTYVKAPLIDGENPYDNDRIWPVYSSTLDLDNLPELSEDIFADLG